MKTESITPALSAYEKIVAAHEKLLAERKAAEQAAAAKAAAEQAAIAERLRPKLDAAAALRNRLTETQSRRDELTRQIEFGEILRQHQTGLNNRLNELIESTFGQPGPGGSAPDCNAAMWTIPKANAERYSELILPRLEKWLAARRVELAAVETELSKLAAEVK